MSATSVHASTPTTSARRPVMLRVGLFLCLFLLLLGTLPAVLDFGLNGSGWDVVVIITAVLMPSMTVATLALIPFAWNGRRPPSTAVAVIQIASTLLALPAFVVAIADGLPVFVPIIAAVGILLSLFAALLVIRGAEPTI